MWLAALASDTAATSRGFLPTLHSGWLCSGLDLGGDLLSEGLLLQLGLCVAMAGEGDGSGDAK